uniref:Uncharacterized protein n=1 Tax=Aegilops tauschii subsp. strangulata TaxID=200361 RepID=A0A453QQJ7_AEGTS
GPWYRVSSKPAEAAQKLLLGYCSRLEYVNQISTLSCASRSMRMNNTTSSTACNSVNSIFSPCVDD